MKTIWAKQALLPVGWADDVALSIDDTGKITRVHKGAAPQGKCVGLLLPAPLNAHSHSFQRAMAGMSEHRGPDASDSFWTWRRLMFRFLDRLTPDHVEAITAFVQMEMLQSGYATNVEFHYLHHQPGGAPYNNLAEMSERIAAATAQSGIGLCLLPVHYQFGGCDGRPLGPGQIRFGNTLDRFSDLHADAIAATRSLPDDTSTGAAPHSLRAVGQDDLRAYHTHFPDGPLHLHLAEQIAEVAEVEASWGARPVEWVLHNMAPGPRWCAIHCTQMTPDETRRLARTGAVAGLCPITESNLGDGIFDAVGWLGAEGKIAVGSDSNIRISLTEEIRTLEYSQRLRDHTRASLATPDRSTGRRMYDEMVAGGAQAAARHTGKIETGYWADLLALDTDHIHLAERHNDSALDAWIFAGDDHLITDVWSAGRHLVKDGQHVRQGEITAAYRKTLAALRDAL